MIVKNNVAQFFSTRPALDKVPQLGIEPRERQNLAIRPPTSGEGVGLILSVSPGVQALFNSMISQTIWLELRKKDKDIIRNLLILFLLRDSSSENISLDFALQLNQAILRKDRKSKAELSQKSQRFLGFQPSLAIARDHIVVECFRLWFNKSRIIHPLRKRGYDDKGSLAPPGSISWQELALSEQSGERILKATSSEISHFITGLRSRVLSSSDESQSMDENPGQLLIKEYSLCGSQ